MPFFKKKPVVIEARQLTKDNFDEVFSWSNSNDNCYLARSMYRPLVIQTLEGDLQATIGDWIIKGVKGEFYPCKSDVFEMTYQPMTDHPITAQITLEKALELVEFERNCFGDWEVRAVNSTVYGDNYGSVCGKILCGVADTIDGRHWRFETPKKSFNDCFEGAIEAELLKLINQLKDN